MTSCFGDHKVQLSTFIYYCSFIITSAIWLFCPDTCLSKRPILSVYGAGGCAHCSLCSAPGAWEGASHLLVEHAVSEMAGGLPHGAEWTRMCICSSVKMPAVAARGGSLSWAVSDRLSTLSCLCWRKWTFEGAGHGPMGMSFLCLWVQLF